MIELKWSALKYFKQSEFDSPDEPGSGARMNLPFVFRLDTIRDMVGRPLRINSGYRTPAHNKAVGGVANSAHTKGLAADIRVTDDEMRALVVRAAIKAGFTRIGVGRGLVHLDADSSLPTPRMWLYGG